jgi:hypothetical protein
LIDSMVRDTGAMSADAEWYWDLNRKKAVPASERGAFDHVLGPYRSRQEAENWSAKVEERNEGWDEADQAWEHAGEPDDD